VEQDDDAYDDIRNLYDTEVSCVMTCDFSVASGVAGGIMLSCASQLARLGGVRVTTATQFAAG